MNTLYDLKCCVQHYAWGKPGSTSSVAKLLRSSQSSGHSQCPVSDSEPYAELWMGTHVNGPSKIIVNNETLPLLDFLREHPNLLSLEEKEPGKIYEGGDLAYLFKILSINKALSIQAHPNKQKARELHKAFPSIYKDGNHKPEMAIALTPFEALVGFQSHQSIAHNIETVPELKILTLSKLSVTPSKLIEIKFKALMHNDKTLIKEQCDLLVERLSKKSDLLPQEELALKLNDEYPGDVGVFCAFFLHHVVLSPGEAVFLEASVPHAYIDGDCVEIMARSDNVIRAGLTPKYRDVDTLCEILKYDTFDNSQILHGEQYSPNVKIFQPSDESVTEFELELIEAKEHDEFFLPVVEYACIILVKEGECKTQENRILKSGDVIFQPAGNELKICAKEGLLMFRAKKRTQDINSDGSTI